MTPDILRTVLIGGFVAFMMYRRVKRQIGRQEVRPKATWFRIVLLSLLSVLFLAVTFFTGSPPWAALGFVPGFLLAAYALRHTTFETTPEGRFYTPNPWFGALVSALLIGRIVARAATAYAADGGHPAGGPPSFATFQRSPLTLGLFFLLAAYHVTYGLGVLRRSPKQAPAPAPVAEAA